MSNENIQSHEPDNFPAEYFTTLLNDKLILHDSILKRVLGEDVWSRQREIEELSHTSLVIDAKGLINNIVSGIEIDEDNTSETSDQIERDMFVDVEEELMNVERTYLNGFIVSNDEQSPYLVKRNNPQLLVDPISGKRSIVRFLEFITTSPDGDVQREWYSSTGLNRDYDLSLLAWERQESSKTDDVELHQSALEDEHKLLLFMALENLNDLYRRLLDLPDDELRSQLSQ